MKERIAEIVKILNEGIFEREETIAVSLLAALSGQNIFLLGPPGTAKSLIARRLSHAFETNGYFEYLMHRFSTPEEVFGPVSITELKKDNFVRKTEGFLPQSEFAFLDEIWKSSPSILNTLLTIINEKSYRNGTEMESAPLKALIAASNETPPPDQGLDALYDRFLVRLDVPPMEAKENFETLLKSEPTDASIELPAHKIKHVEWLRWRNEIHAVQLSEETLNIIHDIRLSFAEKGEALDVYVSDRRWQRASILLKAAALFCGRNKTNLVDTLLLRHCLWTSKDNYADVVKIVEDAVRNYGFETGVSLQTIDREKDDLEREINKELYHSKDVYGTKTLRDGKEYFECRRELNGERVTFFIPAKKMNSKEKFHPRDKEGNELVWIWCNFASQGTCCISIDEHQDSDYYISNWVDVNDFTPKILFHKGDRKSDVNDRLVLVLKDAIMKTASKIDDIRETIDTKSAQFEKESDTPFVPENIRRIALESVEKQLQDVKLRRKDCDRIKKLIG